MNPTLARAARDDEVARVEGHCFAEVGQDGPHGEGHVRSVPVLDDFAIGPGDQPEADIGSLTIAEIGPLLSAFLPNVQSRECIW